MYFCLSRPLADSEKLPVRSHRAAEAAKSPAEDGDAESGASQEPKKKSSKEKREKKKDKDRDRKVGLKCLFISQARFLPFFPETTLTSFCLADVPLKPSKSDLWSCFIKRRTTTKLSTTVTQFSGCVSQP